MVILLACVFVPGIMSQGRFSYSRVVVVGVILCAFSAAGFVAGRVGGGAAGEDPDNVRLISDLKASQRIANFEIASLKQRLVERNNEEDGSRVALSMANAFRIVQFPVEKEVKLKLKDEAINLALGNIIAVFPETDEVAAVSTVAKTDFMTPHAAVKKAALTPASVSIAAMSVTPLLFLTIDDELKSLGGLPGWSGPPLFTGLDLKRAVLPSVDGGGVGSVKFFGGLTEKEFRTREIRCLAKAIYHESRGEVQKGQFAVAQTIMNRVRDDFFPDTICGVIYENSHKRNRCQFSFACDGISDKPKDKKLWELALENARMVALGKVWLEDIGYASHYHATYVRPNWRRYMRRIKKIGIHIFYRAKFLPLAEELVQKTFAKGLGPTHGSGSVQTSSE